MLLETYKQCVHLRLGKKHLEMTGISVMSALLCNQAIIDPQISGKYLHLLGQTKRRPDLVINKKLDISSLCLWHFIDSERRYIDQSKTQQYLLDGVSTRWRRC